MKKASFTLITLMLLSLSISSSHAQQAKQNKVKPYTKSEKSIGDIAMKIRKMVMSTKRVEDKVIHVFDYDGDGKQDAELTLIGEEVFSEKLDYDKDGKFDKQVWNYQTGDVLTTVSEDKNLDGKIDYKLVKTLKGAKKGHFIMIEYKDKDHDGKFDSKKTTEVEIHQAGGPTGPNCINCATGEYENAHLPRIIDQEAEYHLETFLKYSNRKNPALLRSLKPQGELKFKIHVQKDCFGDSFKPLFEMEDSGDENQYPKLIQDSLETGMRCMENLALDSRLPNNPSAIQRRVEDARVRTATNNMVKAVGGLIGYSFLELQPGQNDQYIFDQYHGQRLSFICNSHGQINEGEWIESAGNMTAQTYAGDSAESRDIFAKGTIAKRGVLTNHVNDVRGRYSAPNIVFNPNIANLLRDNGPWVKEYNGQGRTEKFKELVFHEYLHTALGTMHTNNESQVDLAQTCGDFCFHNPAPGDKIGVEIKKLSGDICSGQFAGPNPEYKAKMRRLKCLRAMKKRNPATMSSELPPTGQGSGMCPAGSLL